MTLDGSEVIVGNSGHVYVAPVGTALPAAEDTTLDTAFADLGYFSESGVTVTIGRQVAEVRAWQSYAPLRRIITSQATSFAFEMEQWNSDTAVLALGGGTVTEPTADHFMLTPPTPDDGPSQWALVLDVTDEAGTLRFVTAKVELEGDVSIAFTRNSAAVLPVTLTVLDTGTSALFQLLTDDAAFAAS
jgi:hypothetical protein